MTDALWIVAGLILLALVFGAGRFFAGKRREPESPLGSARIPAPGAVPEDMEDLAREVVPLLARKQKIDAIKLVRSRTGLGLKEAKDWVEAIERR